MPAFKDHFSDNAAEYARHRPQYPVALVGALSEHCPQHARAWDAGCGNGQLSVLLAERFEQVVATDASAEQIGHAQAHPRVSYRVARAEDGAAQTGLDDRSVDLCVAAQAAHWFEMDAFNAQLRRVSRPRGVAALISYGLMTVALPAVDDVIRAFYFGDLAAFWPIERRHVDDAYARLSFPFEPLPMPTLAIECHWTLAALLGYLDTWSAIAAMKKAGGHAKVAQFTASLAAAWGEPGASFMVTFPLKARAARI